MTDSSQTPGKRRQIHVEMPPTLVTHYANAVMISHTAGEIVFDFVHLLPNLPVARVQSRVVLTPTNAKLLHKALGENLEKYESKFEEIKTPPTLADQLFQMVRPPESPEGEDSAHTGDEA